ncbi:hypothetical protein MTO98_26185 [Mucilaginibacter sp. SMC90]|uniref:hypothetical protein n=1 Tax=Mucilaginibacter sp. SMC90 TaxID=2929803 RepID=UPI001FB2E37C|nr:hypothetical protein [Mucilaginibacter sp. SMC90]UOE47904.1 hypothetical protein MTO98_26185 [Mucilaginibacter sp. SMC90]
MKTLIRSIILLSAVMLAGCRIGLSGTYKQSGGLMGGMVSGKMTFISGSKVDIEINGMTAECAYERMAIK